MVKYQIPLTNQEVDTKDGASDGVAMPIFLSVAAVTTLAGVVGAGTFVYNRVRAAAGVEEGQIPGV